jgi:hypothetical protein
MDMQKSEITFAVRKSDEGGYEAALSGIPFSRTPIRSMN